MASKYDPNTKANDQKRAEVNAAVAQAGAAASAAAPVMHGLNLANLQRDPPAAAVAAAAAPPQSTEADQDHQTAMLAHHLLSRYPPDTHHYVGLGRSPTPVMAYLQAMAGHNDRITSSNLPLSKFSPSEPSLFGGRQPNMTDALTDEQTARLHDHFDNFIPGTAALRGKSVVLTDFVTSGRSLRATQNHLQRYLNKRDGGLFSGGPTVKAVPLTSHEMMGQTTRQMDQIGIDQPPLTVPGRLDDATSLASMMGAEKFKPAAEYGEYNVATATNARSGQMVNQRNPAYAGLVARFDRHIDPVDPAGYEADDDEPDDA